MATIVVTTTIQAAFDMAVAGDVVYIPLRATPYDESIVPKTGVDALVEDNVLIQYTGADGLPTLTDGGGAVVTHWTGVESYPGAPFRFFIKREGEGNSILMSNPASHFNIFTNRGTIEGHSLNFPTVKIMGGLFEWMGTNIFGDGDALVVHGGVVKLGGDFWDGYGGVGSLNGIPVVMYGGVATIYGNLNSETTMPCIDARGGLINYCGWAHSYGIPIVRNGGAVKLGGVINNVDWAFLESFSTDPLWSSAILEVGAGELQMADTTLKCIGEAITTHGEPHLGTIVVAVCYDEEGTEILPDYCYAYSPIQTTPPLNITGIENLKAWPEINRSGEPQLTANVVQMKPNQRQVTLDWYAPKPNPDFAVLRDGKVLGHTDKQTYKDIVKGGKPQIRYTVQNIVPTLTPTEASVIVEK